MIAASDFLQKGIDKITKEDELPDLADLWDRGFGSVDLVCMVRFSGLSSLGTSLVSNIPQLIVSIIYAAINDMWTAMMVANEWNGYGLRRKSLRTTTPVGQQRSTYWLSLPWVVSPLFHL